MNPNEALLFLLVPLLAAALVATGYWLGRAAPVASASARRRAALARRVEPQRADRASQLAAEPDTSERLRRDIESQVRALRRSRAPAVAGAAAPRLPLPTRVEASPSEAVFAAWFADTTIEPHTASRPH